MLIELTEKAKNEKDKKDDDNDNGNRWKNDKDV
jgi:hypothetical protein